MLAVSGAESAALAIASQPHGLLTEDTTVRNTSTISAFGLAAAAALTLTSQDVRAQSGAPAPPPPPGFEGQAAPPPPGYYVPPSVAASGPRRITDWEEGEPIPPGYHPVTRIRKGLVIGGAVTFGVVYLTTALIGAAVSDLGAKSGKLLLIPIAGPFATLSTGTTSGDFFLVLNGIVQAGGVAMLIAGIAAPKTILIRNDLGKPKLELLPTPMTFGANSGGFGFVGKF
jgi:hypothetical protein